MGGGHAGIGKAADGGCDSRHQAEGNLGLGKGKGLFAAAAEGSLAGILGYETRPLVSADYCNDTRSSIIDAPSTMVTDGTLLKVYAWYDNEMGYVCRMVDLANMVIEAGA